MGGTVESQSRPMEMPNKIEVTGVHAHASYLRVYVAVTGRARASSPCPKGTLPEPLPIPNAEP